VGLLGLWTDILLVQLCRLQALLLEGAWSARLPVRRLAGASVLLLLGLLRTMLRPVLLMLFRVRLLRLLL